MRPAGTRESAVPRRREGEVPAGHRGMRADALAAGGRWGTPGRRGPRG